MAAGTDLVVEFREPGGRPVAVSRLVHSWATRRILPAEGANYTVDAAAGTYFIKVQQLQRDRHGNL